MLTDFVIRNKMFIMPYDFMSSYDTYVPIILLLSLSRIITIVNTMIQFTNKHNST